MRQTSENAFSIVGKRKLASLTSPVRQEILDAMHALGRASVAEIADAVNRAPDSLYYHLRILLEVGLVRKAGERLAGTRRETIYDLPGRPLKIKYGNSPVTRAAIGKTISSMLRLADRDFQSAILNNKIKLDSNDSVLNGARLKAWLAPAQIVEIKEHLLQIERIMSNGKKTRDSELIAFTRLLIPVEEKKRSRNPKNEKN